MDLINFPHFETCADFEETSVSVSEKRLSNKFVSISFFREHLTMVEEGFKGSLNLRTFLDYF